MSFEFVSIQALGMALFSTITAEEHQTFLSKVVRQMQNFHEVLDDGGLCYDAMPDTLESLPPSKKNRIQGVIRGANYPLKQIKSNKHVVSVSYDTSSFVLYFANAHAQWQL